jgi:hypothetical protein
VYGDVAEHRAAAHARDEGYHPVRYLVELLLELVDRTRDGCQDGAYEVVGSQFWPGQRVAVLGEYLDGLVSDDVRDGLGLLLNRGVLGQPVRYFR